MRCMHLLNAAAVSLFALFGCATNYTDSGWREPLPLGRDLRAYRPPIDPPDISTDDGSKEDGSVKEPTGVLTLRHALAVALLHNPELAAFSWEVRAREAGVLQADLLPNPELDVELEQFGGTGVMSGLQSAQTTLRLSQLIVLGGKISKRTKVATLATDVSGWDYEGKRLDVFAKTAKAFVEVLAAQESVAVYEDMYRLTAEALRVVSERVQAGKVSPLAQTKAEVSLATSQIDLNRAKQQLRSSRYQLAASWGSNEPTFDQVTGSLQQVDGLPSYDVLSRKIFQNPTLARLKTEIALRKAASELAESQAIPDLTVTGGGQRFEDTDDFSFTAGFSIPIPLFDRNQGGSLEASYLVQKARTIQRAEEVRILTELKTSYEALRFAHLEALSLANQVLPAAQLAFDAASEGYRQGKFGYLELLDAQRTLAQVRSQYVGSLAAYHKSVADVERLVAQPMARPASTENNQNGGPAPHKDVAGADRLREVNHEQ